jgi:hypothetical protein
VRIAQRFDAPRHPALANLSRMPGSPLGPEFCCSPAEVGCCATAGARFAPRRRVPQRSAFARLSPSGGSRTSLRDAERSGLAGLLRRASHGPCELRDSVASSVRIGSGFVSAACGWHDS